MAKINCKYHSNEPARWYCETCGVNVCRRCVSHTSVTESSPHCAVCRGRLTSVGIGNSITPFWERIPKFFAYPFKVDALVYLGLLSLLSLGSFLPLVGIIVYLLVSYAILKYGYIVLIHTAQGRLSPPSQFANNLATNNKLPLRQFGVFFLMGVIVVTAGGLLGRTAAIAAILFMLFTLPASVLTLTITGSILQAVNPAMLARIVGAMGWPYLILYLFLMFLSAGSGIVMEILQPVLPEWLLLIVGIFVSGMFTVIMFNMMGYAVYQYHEPLGYEQVQEFNDKKAGAASMDNQSVDPFLNEISILVAEGKFGEAKDRLGKRVQASGTLEERQHYHKLLKASGDTEELARHGMEYVHMLAAMERPQQALDTWSDCLRADPAGRLRDGRLTYTLAELACGQGRHDLALQILNRFAKNFQNHSQIPRAYLLAARILCEHKSQDAGARKILIDVLRLYPDTEAKGDIESYLNFVDRVAAGSESASSV